MFLTYYLQVTIVLTDLGFGHISILNEKNNNNESDSRNDRDQNSSLIPE